MLTAAGNINQPYTSLGVIHAVVTKPAKDPGCSGGRGLPIQEAFDAVLSALEASAAKSGGDGLIHVSYDCRGAGRGHRRAPQRAGRRAERRRRGGGPDRNRARLPAGIDDGLLAIAARVTEQMPRYEGRRGRSGSNRSMSSGTVPWSRHRAKP